jgi:hypothetical protein
MKIKLISTAKNQFIETSIQTIENTEFLMLRFLYFLNNQEFQKRKEE